MTKALRSDALGPITTLWAFSLIWKQCYMYKAPSGAL